MYEDRAEAGTLLARKLGHLKANGAVVLALPRGGIVPAAKVAEALQAPLGLVLVRKIGHPDWPEYAIGAVAERDEPLYNPQELLHTDKQWLMQAEAAARNLIEQRRRLYYSDFTPPDPAGKTAVIVDDGIATGLTMEAAVRSIGKQAERVVVAVPVAAADTVATLEKLADEVVVLENPEQFRGAVGAHYRHFEQVTDEEVRNLLQATAARNGRQ